ncbi:hypothetical protein PT974_00355 [Cladobotryum mycophilum]|uniref:Uncharacterized protein n=1 Tax=Cladobotryum mycophilum TaxID=491253 RepID=A0ABR0T1V6_9HYPO
MTWSDSDLSEAESSDSSCAADSSPQNSLITATTVSPPPPPPPRPPPFVMFLWFHPSSGYNVSFLTPPPWFNPLHWFPSPESVLAQVDPAWSLVPSGPMAMNPLAATFTPAVTPELAAASPVIEVSAGVASIVRRSAANPSSPETPVAESTADEASPAPASAADDSKQPVTPQPRSKAQKKRKRRKQKRRSSGGSGMAEQSQCDVPQDDGDDDDDAATQSADNHQVCPATPGPSTYREETPAFRLRDEEFPELPSQSEHKSSKDSPLAKDPRPEPSTSSDVSVSKNPNDTQRVSDNVKPAIAQKSQAPDEKKTALTETSVTKSEPQVPDEKQVSKGSQVAKPQPQVAAHRPPPALPLTMSQAKQRSKQTISETTKQETLATPATPAVSETSTEASSDSETSPTPEVSTIPAASPDIAVSTPVQPIHSHFAFGNHPQPHYHPNPLFPPHGHPIYSVSVPHQDQLATPHLQQAPPAHFHRQPLAVPYPMPPPVSYYQGLFMGSQHLMPSQRPRFFPRYIAHPPYEHETMYPYVSMRMSGNTMAPLDPPRVHFAGFMTPGGSRPSPILPPAVAQASNPQRPPPIAEPRNPPTSRFTHTSDTPTKIPVSTGRSTRLTTNGPSEQREGIQEQAHADPPRGRPTPQFLARAENIDSAEQVSDADHSEASVPTGNKKQPANYMLSGPPTPDPKGKRRARTLEHVASSSTQREAAAGGETKGPASFQPGPSTSMTPKSTPNKPESAAWTQSKRWMSQETKERLAFQKMTLNLHYMGADKSPFVPQSPAQLTAFKAQVAEIQKQQLDRKVGLLEQRSKLKDGEKEQGAVPQMQIALFNGKALHGRRLSPLFASSNCFNDVEPEHEMFRVDWPSLAELKEDGDRRAGKYGRYFPLPRMNMEKKAVKLDSLDLIPVDGPAAEAKDGKDDVKGKGKQKEPEPVPEPDLEDLSGIFANFIDWITKEFSTEEHIEEEKN